MFSRRRSRPRDLRDGELRRSAGTDVRRAPRRTPARPPRQADHPTGWPRGVTPRRPAVRLTAAGAVPLCRVCRLAFRPCRALVGLTTRSLTVSVHPQRRDHTIDDARFPVGCNRLLGPTTRRPVDDREGSEEGRERPLFGVHTTRPAGRPSPCWIALLRRHPDRRQASHARVTGSRDTCRRSGFLDKTLS